MCGIAGELTVDQPLPEAVEAMVSSLRHRGPDDSGIWSDPQAGITLGHARLAILDLSPTGRQPMNSRDGRYWIALNGEVYNFRALRRELEDAGLRLRGRSDTEVALECISRRGLLEAVRSFNGMFAFALWDRRERLLHLVRDRLGEKPLYYGWMGRSFLFGSELKALRAHPAFKPAIDRRSLALYLGRNFIPAPRSIYAGISKLLPGTILTVGADPGRPLEPSSYWKASQVAEAGASSPFGGSQEEALERLDQLLRDAVRLRMEADVPLGAFLSGGIDSSLVAALMQAQTAKPVKTFTIGFSDDAFDESSHARAVASHLGTEHTEHFMTPQQAMGVTERLPRLYDEPFADSSQIPTCLVSELARRSVTVNLSGDGGDELFGGYPHYQSAPLIWSQIGWLPFPWRREASRFFRGVSGKQADILALLLSPWLRNYGRMGNAGDKIGKLADVLDMRGPEDVYERLTRLWGNPEELIAGSEKGRAPKTDGTTEPSLRDFRQTMMYRDSMAYLPDDILVKLDRASMGASLESRLPYLDHRVFEFAWSLPPSFHLDSRRSKILLRRLCARYVPGSLLDRPKMGFGMPIGEWLRGPLRPWAESLLAEESILKHGVLDPAPVRARWLEHLSGRRQWPYHLWNVLMLQAWLEDGRRPPPSSSSRAGPSSFSPRVLSDSPRRYALLPVGNEDHPSSRIRGYSLRRSLNDLGVWARVGFHQEARVLFFQGRWDLEALTMARWGREHGRMVVFDLTDAQDTSHPNFLKMLRLAHLVTTPHHLLGKWLQRRYGIERTDVVPDMADYGPLEPARLQPADASPLRILWFSFSSNLSLLSKYLPELARIPDAEFLAAVHQDDVAHLQRRYPSVSFTAWGRDSFINLLRTCHLSCLMHDGDPAHLLKSNNRMVTSILWGVPAVVSRTPAYAETAREAGVETALFSGPDELRGAIERLRSGPAREEYLKRAQGPLWSRHAPEAVAKTFISVLGRHEPPLTRASAMEPPEPGIRLREKALWASDLAANVSWKARHLLGLTR